MAAGQHRNRGFVSLGIAAAFLAASSAAAQTPAIAGRLTVRPQTMATGTRNAAAGWQALDSAPAGSRPPLIYVPPQCVGERRCPLVLHLHDRFGVPKHADRYGIIGLVPREADFGPIDGSGYEPNEPWLMKGRP